MSAYARYAVTHAPRRRSPTRAAIASASARTVRMRVASCSGTSAWRRSRRRSTPWAMRAGVSGRRSSMVSACSRSAAAVRNAARARARRPARWKPSAASCQAPMPRWWNARFSASVSSSPDRCASARATAAWSAGRSGGTISSYATSRRRSCVKSSFSPLTPSTPRLISSSTRAAVSSFDSPAASRSSVKSNGRRMTAATAASRWLASPSRARRRAARSRTRGGKPPRARRSARARARSRRS